MNKIVPGEQNSPRYSGDYPVHVNKIVPSEQNRSKYEQNRSKYEQNSPREQDSPREQNSLCTIVILTIDK